MLSTAAAGIAVTIGALVAAATSGLLHRLPEPANDQDAAEKVPYRKLATARFATGCGVLTAAAVAGILAFAPIQCWPAYAPLALFGVVIAMIDNQTTWIPRPLSHASWIGLVVASAVVAITGDWDTLGLMAAGAGIATLILAVTWWFTNLGFGDVRLAPLVGAAAGSLGLEWGLAALLIGTVLSGLHMLARHISGRRTLHPFAPALVTGAFLTLPISHLIG